MAKINFNPISQLSSCAAVAYFSRMTPLTTTVNSKLAVYQATRLYSHQSNVALACLTHHQTR